MRTRTFLLGCALLALASTARAEQPSLDQLRETMLSSEAQYYLRVAQDLQQQLATAQKHDAELAAYWAEVWKALPKEEKK